MSVLIGHPTGNPNSYNAALAYFEAGLLESFCVAWIPSRTTMQVLNSIGPLGPAAQRFGRRRFAPLEPAPKVQGRLGEFCRLLMRFLGVSGAQCSDLGNRWLMRTMARECHQSTVTAVHSYEDCSLSQFMAAKRLGKLCIYDMPTSYYPTWEKTQAGLRRKYSDWIRPDVPPATHEMRLEQKRQEMVLADLTLVASRYVETTIREVFPHKNIARAPYGVDVEYWTPGRTKKPLGPLRFIYAGQISLRKGLPLLIEAWSRAELRDAELAIVGSWALSDNKRSSLPRGITWVPPCSSQALRERYRESDVFVFPSFSDGFGLALLEAMASGLPAIASEASIGPEIITPSCGFVTPPGELDRLVELLRWFSRHRDELPAMGRAARSQAARCTWSNYRSLITRSVIEAGMI
jgi:glycosyltransferase involved in cell wall biosynthesis